MSANTSQVFTKAGYNNTVTLSTANPSASASSAGIQNAVVATSAGLTEIRIWFAKSGPVTPGQVVDAFVYNTSANVWVEAVPLVNQGADPARFSMAYAPAWLPKLLSSGWKIAFSVRYTDSITVYASAEDVTA